MRKKNRILWMTVLVLFSSISCTASLWVKRIEGYAQRPHDVLNLFPKNLNENDAVHVKASVDSLLSEKENFRREAVFYQRMQTQEKELFGFAALDDRSVWSMDTQIELFRISYVNGDSEITVNSENQDKVIAPGTMNSYTFRLKNTGTASSEYTLSVEAFFAPEDAGIPVKARLSRADENWTEGNAMDYVNVLDLNQVSDAGVLNSGKEALYVLEWIWPFESGDDRLDTFLGNRAVSEDLVLTVKIKTVASMPSAVNTSDDSRVLVWITAAAVSCVMMLGLMMFRIKDERDEIRRKS